MATESGILFFFVVLRSEYNGFYCWRIEMIEAADVRYVILSFFSIGVLSNFKRLWAEGIGKLAAVYFVSLFGLVIWVGLLISWLFFAGVKPPLAG
jgi:hypothetical protein